MNIDRQEQLLKLADVIFMYVSEPENLDEIAIGFDNFDTVLNMVSDHEPLSYWTKNVLVLVSKMRETFRAALRHYDGDGSLIEQIEGAHHEVGSDPLEAATNMLNLEPCLPEGCGCPFIGYSHLLRLAFLNVSLALALREADLAAESATQIADEAIGRVLH